jgi:predicted hydrocarbon binding protein
MFKIVSNLILHNKIRFEQGSIKLFEKDVALFPVDYIVFIQKRLESEGKGNYLYKSAKDNGIKWMTNLKDRYNLDKECLFEWGINTLSVAGWGETEILQVDYKQKLVWFNVKNSTFANGYGKSNHCVDNFIRGSFAGGLSVMFGVDCDSVELSCRAKGDSFCRFVVKPSTKFDMTDKEVSEQLS